ncbi:MAG: collagen-binding domain-containing protein, partial [Armatimonadota bacterium]
MLSESCYHRDLCGNRGRTKRVLRNAAPDVSGRTPFLRRHLSLRIVFALFLLLLPCINSGARAQTTEFKDLGLAANYNLFSFGKATLQKDSSSEGRLAAGGNLNLNDAAIATKMPGAGADWTVVAGKPGTASGGLTGNSGTIQGSVFVTGGNTSLTSPSISGNVAGNERVNLNGGGRIQGGLTYGDVPFKQGNTKIDGQVRQGQTAAPLDIQSLQNDLTALSDWLKVQQTNQVTTVGTDGTITFATSLRGRSVFAVSAAQLNAATGLIIQCGASGTVVINVTSDGPNAQCHLKNMGMSLQRGITASRILFNFPDFSRVSVSRTRFLGSILAPRANAALLAGGTKNEAALRGTLVCDSYEGDGAFESAPFTGDLTNGVKLFSLTINPPEVSGGSASSATVTLDAPAPAGNAIISISSSSPSVAWAPASTVTVPAGQTSATFPISTAAVTSRAVVTFTASWNGDSKTAQLIVNPPPLPQVTALAVNPISVRGGVSSTGTVTLSAAAPGPNGALVSLSDTSSAAATPVSVTVAAGATQASFSITTVPVRTSTPVTLTAAYNGSQASAVLTVEPPKLVSLSISPDAVDGGDKATGTVTLDGPAPAGDLPVTLSDNSPSVTVPGTVTVKAGDTTATFTIQTSVVAQQTVATVSGSLNGLTRTATITVRPLRLLSIVLDPDRVRGGLPSKARVTVSQPAPAGGLTVTLSANTPAATPPPSVGIPAGETSATFDVATIPVAAAAVATISGTLGGDTTTGLLTIVPPAILSVTLDPATVVGGNPSTGTVTLDGPAPAGDLPVTLSENSAAVTVPGTVTVEAGKTRA